MKKKVLIVFLVLIFLYCIGGVIYSVVVRQNINNQVNDSVMLTIKNYEYTINEDKETSLYKSEFNNLKGNLESDKIDLKGYATSIAKLYIIDLYTLNTKSNKYDITSKQYVHFNGRDNYNLKVSETLYKFIEDNSAGRVQELPEVSEVIIKNFEESTYTIGSTEYFSYIINMEWLYTKDLGYDNSAVITLINDNDVISVVEEQRVEDLSLESQKNS